MTRSPLVSVVMPVRNEAAFLRDSLGSVLGQDYPSDNMEVFVVDGCSDDETAHMAASIADDAIDGPPVTVLRNEKRVVPAALNLALAQARGDIVVRVDGHCELEPDYVRRCVDALDRTLADNVGGLQRARARGLVGRAIAAATSSPFGVGGARFHYARSAGWADTVYLGAYRRDVFSRIGLFDEDLVR